MVMLMTAGPVVVYRVRDGAGEPIGEVVEPRSAPVMARGAGTVLLSRDEVGNCSGALLNRWDGQRESDLRLR
jgi:hypothetical protein